MYLPSNIAELLNGYVVIMKRVTLYAPEERQIAERHLDELVAESTRFTELEDRTREGLWSLLGSIYEIAPTIENVPARKELLIARVAIRADVAGNNQWQPRTKKVDDLLLVLLFGLQGRQTKSQRLSALRVAAKQGIERSRARYIEWIRQVGGVEGARKLAKCPASNGNGLGSYANRLKDFEPGYQGIATPRPLTDTDFPSGLGVVLVRRNADGDLLPLGTLTNEKLVASAARHLLRELDLMSQDFRKEIEADLKERERPKREAHKRLVRLGLFEGEFGDYLDAGAPMEL